MVHQKPISARLDLDVDYELTTYLHDRPISRNNVLNRGARMWLHVEKARIAYRKAADDTELQEKILADLLLKIFPEVSYYHKQSQLLKK